MYVDIVKEFVGITLCFRFLELLGWFFKMMVINGVVFCRMFEFLRRDFIWKMRKL